MNVHDKGKSSSQKSPVSPKKHPKPHSHQNHHHHAHHDHPKSPLSLTTHRDNATMTSPAGSPTSSQPGCKGSELHSQTLQDRESSRKRLIIATILCSTFFVIELVGGILSGSLALFSDAFHLLSDIASFILSLVALYLASQPATKTHSFGYHRAEILGALGSIVLIWILTGVLVWEAIDRLRNPQPIEANVMVITAGAGVVVNLIMMFVLGHGHHHHGHGHDHDHGHDHGHGHHHHHHHEPSDLERGGLVLEETSDDGEEEEEEHGENCDHTHDHDHEGPRQSGEHAHLLPKKRPRKKHININVHSALLHVIGDLVFSIGVLISSLIIYFDPTKVIIDPICTFLFSFIVLLTTFKLFFSSLTVLMEGTPKSIDSHELSTDLSEIPNVRSVHDLHIWGLTMDKYSLAVHIEVDRMKPRSSPHKHISSEEEDADYEPTTAHDLQQVLLQAQEIICDKYGIHHSTIQVELFDPDNAHDDGFGGRLDGHCRSYVCNM